MSPWQYVYEQLSGGMPGGFALYFVLLISTWAIWGFVYIFSSVVDFRMFRKWGLLLTVTVVGLYTVQRVRHPAPLFPQRLWVQPFETQEEHAGDADCARFALERILEETDETVVGFQTRDMGEAFLNRISPGNPSDKAAASPEGTRLVRASLSAVGIYETDGSLSTLNLTAYRINWKGEVEKTAHISSSGGSPAEAGRNAAIKLAEEWDLKTSTHCHPELYTPEILAAFFKADTSKSSEDAVAALCGAFTSPDSSEAMLWEALADHYYRKFFPDQRDKIDHAIRRCVQFDQRAARTYFIQGQMLWVTGLQREAAIAGWKLAYLYDRRDSDPLLAMANLYPKEIRDLRLGGKKKMLDYALRLRPSCIEARRIKYRYTRDNLMQKVPSKVVVDEGLMLNPDHPRLLMMKAVVSIQMAKYDTAEVALNRILKNHPFDANTWYNMGIVQKAKRNVEAARDAFEMSLANDGPNDAHYYLGLYYLMKNNKEKALYHFRWRWALRNNNYDDFFAVASQERIRQIKTGKTRFGVPLPEWYAFGTDSTAVENDIQDLSNPSVAIEEEEKPIPNQMDNSELTPRGSK